MIYPDYNHDNQVGFEIILADGTRMLFAGSNDLNEFIVGKSDSDDDSAHESESKSE